jgi:hypothetical protein
VKSHHGREGKNLGRLVVKKREGRWRVERRKRELLPNLERERDEDNEIFCPKSK